MLSKGAQLSDRSVGTPMLTVLVSIVPSRFLQMKAFAGAVKVGAIVSLTW